LLFEFLKIAHHFVNSGRVVFLYGHSQQLTGIIETGRQLIDCDDDPLERRAFLAKGLRTCRVIPDIGLLEFALNFG